MIEDKIHKKVLKLTYRAIEGKVSKLPNTEYKYYFIKLGSYIN